MQKNVKFSLIGIFLVIIFILFGYLFFIQSKGYNRVNANIEVISEQENKISLVDKYPMSDSVGKKIVYSKDNENVQGYYQFDVKNNSNFDTNFEIYISDAAYENNIHTNFIKVYLTDSNNRPISGFEGQAVPTFYNLKVSSIKPIGRRVYYGYLKAKETQNFILRVWVGDAYKVDVDTKNFSLDVHVEAD